MFTGVLLEASRSFVHSPSWPVAGVTTGRVPVMPATVGEGLPESVRGAIGRGDARAVAAWLDEGGGVDARCAELSNATLLMGAACIGHEALVRMLLQRGASVNLQTSGGGTALMNAANFGHTTIVQALLDAKADASLQNINGITALMCAKYEKQVATTQLPRQLADRQVAEAARYSVTLTLNPNPNLQ